MATKRKEGAFGYVLHIHMNRLLPPTETTESEIQPHIIRTLINCRFLLSRRARGSNEWKVPEYT